MVAPEDGWTEEGRAGRGGGVPKGASLGDSAGAEDSLLDLLPVVQGLREEKDGGSEEGEVRAEDMEPANGC